MAYGKVIMRDDDGIVTTKSAKTRGAALEIAQVWCIYGKGKPIRSANVVRYRDKKTVIHYWFDDHLQNVLY